MAARGQVALNGIKLLAIAVVPLVNDPIAVQVNADAVVGASLEAIAPGIKIVAAAPANREIIVR